MSTAFGRAEFHKQRWLGLRNTSGQSAAWAGFPHVSIRRADGPGFEPVVATPAPRRSLKFQSAERMGRASSPRVHGVGVHPKGVSIRRADGPGFEPSGSHVGGRSTSSFNPPGGWAGLRAFVRSVVLPCQECFNPPSGWAGLRAWQLGCFGWWFNVSIRRADGPGFELSPVSLDKNTRSMFQSAERMGRASSPVGWLNAVPMLRFQSAERMGRASSFSSNELYIGPNTVSIRRADGPGFELLGTGRTPRARHGFNPPSGWAGLRAAGALGTYLGRSRFNPPSGWAGLRALRFHVSCQRWRSFQSAERMGRASSLNAPASGNAASTEFQSAERMGRASSLTMRGDTICIVSFNPPSGWAGLRAGWCPARSR